jgi:hypothetical protein
MELKRIAPIMALAALAMLLATSCEKTINEGIYGTVKERYGDWMPGSNPPDHGERPIVCEIYAYEYSPSSDYLQAPLVGTATSNKKGFYEIALAPGTYSVFVLDPTNGKLVNANYGNTVTVEEGKAVELNIMLNHAVY